MQRLKPFLRILKKRKTIEQLLQEASEKISVYLDKNNEYEFDFSLTIRGLDLNVVLPVISALNKNTGELRFFSTHSINKELFERIKEQKGDK